MLRDLRTYRLFLLPLLLSCVCLAAAFGTHGAQLVVSKEGAGGFRTIQGAIDAAEYGDTIYVNPGVYEEQISFRDGLHLTGAGPEHTIVRFGYGFDEVLSVRHASSGTIEGLRIERTGTILAAPAVVLESASVLLADCEITGGQGAGIEISGSPSRVQLTRLTVFGNTGHGIYAKAEAHVTVTDSTLRSNGGCGLLADADAVVTIEDSSIEENTQSGIAVLGTAIGALHRVTISSNVEWGLHAASTSSVSASDSHLFENVAGGVRASEDATVHIDRFTVRSGGIGLSIDDRATLRAASGVISETSASGVLALSEGVAELQNIEITGGWSHGADLASLRPASIDHLTLAANLGDGIRLRGAGSTVTNTVIALNQGIGLRVESATAGHDLHHNALWRNGQGDYDGLSRRVSDVVEAPRFADAGSGNYSLLPDSPCIGAGTWGETIGAHPDPAAVPGTDIVLAAMARDPFLNAEWTVQTAWTAPGLRLAFLDLDARYEDSVGSLSITSRVLGVQGRRTAFDAQVALLNIPRERSATPSVSTQVTIGASGQLDGALSDARVWGDGHLNAGRFTLDAHADLRWPTRTTFQRVSAAFGDVLQVGIRASAVDLVPSNLAGTLRVRSGRSEEPFDLAAVLTLVPDPHVQLTGSWASGPLVAGWDAGIYLENPGTIAVSGTVIDWTAGLRAGAGLHLGQGKLESLSVSIGQTTDAIDWSGSFTLLTEGGVRLSVTAKTDLLAALKPRPNILPVPAWSYLPEDPEAGEAIRFDASGSHDPDGAIVETWWDFGDGALAIGDRAEHTYATAGSYVVTITVSDNDGEPASLALPVTVWEADSAPAAAFAWVPVSPEGTSLLRGARAGDAIRLDASSSYAVFDGGLEYAWDLDSDGIFDQIASDPIANLPALDAGHYPVTLRVTDASGRSDAVLHVVVVSEPNSPRTDFSITPRTPSILDPVRFIDQSEDSDGLLVSWHWSFGDGHMSREREPIHRFEAEGEYTVTLTVIDDSGLSSSFERIIQVARAPGVVPVDEVWALVVGVSDYEDVPDLEYAAADAVAVASWIASTGVPADHIRLLTRGADGAEIEAGFTSRDATLVQVREGLGWLRRMADQDDLVLIYFSGHGYRGPDDDGDERDGVDEFFVLSDTRSAAIDDTALRDDEFGRFLDRIASEHILVLFDGCHSGGLSRSLPDGRRPIGESPDRFTDLSLEGRLVLSAAGEAQDAFESPSLGHGVFTHFVLEGLKGAADLNGDSRVTAWELYEYVRVEVADFVLAERGAIQVPQIAGEGETRVIVASSQETPHPLLNYAPSVPFAGGAVRFWSEASIPFPEPATWSWSFGDGDSAAGSQTVHVYGDAGTYRVVLSVEAEGMAPQSVEVEVSVAPAPMVTRIDEETGRVLLSIGAQHGIDIGDRFIVEGDGRDAVVLEVLELLDADASACRVVEPELLDRIAVGDPVQPEVTP